VIYPVLELREEKRTFVKVEGGKIDFFPCKSMSTLITGPGPIFWNAALGDFNLLVALWVEHAVV
jgi:hypothetical protein